MPGYEQAYEDLFNDDDSLFEWCDAEVFFDFITTKPGLKQEFIDFLRGHLPTMQAWTKHVERELEDYEENQRLQKADEINDRELDA